jgi:Helicase conserved C-terminal domain
MAAHVATQLSSAIGSASGPITRIIVVCKNQSMGRKWKSMLTRMGRAITEVRAWDLQRKGSPHLPAAHEENLRDVFHGLRATDLVIVDECQHFRNYLAKGSRGVRELVRSDGENQARPYCLLLTATPYSKSLADVAALLALISGDLNGEMSGVEEVVQHRGVVNVTMDFIHEHFGTPLPGRARQGLRFGDRIRSFPDLDVKTRRYQTRMERVIERIDGLNLRFRRGEQVLLSRLKEASDDLDEGNDEFSWPFLQCLLARRAESSPRAFLETITKFKDTLATTDVVPVDDQLPARLDELERLAREGMEEDTKLDSLIEIVAGHPPSRKTLIFTEYTDTAQYLVEELSKVFRRRGIECLTGDASQNQRDKILRRFAPDAQGAPRPRPDRAIHILIATDAVSESEDLQDATSLINYDLPWTPLKLIQRIGRLDRPTLDARVVQVWNFFPDAAIYETLLGHWERLEQRDRENDVLTGTRVVGEFRRDHAAVHRLDTRRWSSALLQHLQEPGAIRALQHEASPRTSWVLDQLVTAPSDLREQAQSLSEAIQACMPGSRPGWYVLLRSGKRKISLFRDERTGEHITAPDDCPHDALVRYIAADSQTPARPVPEDTADKVGELVRAWATTRNQSLDDISIVAAMRILSA